MFRVLSYLFSYEYRAKLLFWMFTVYLLSLMFKIYRKHVIVLRKDLLYAGKYLD